jgi:hypothetical protein
VGSAAQGQVFNVHEIGQQGFAFYNGYNVLAFGQGAAHDPGNNVWNGFGNGQPPGHGWSFGTPHANDGLLPNNPGNPYAWTHQPSFANGPDLFSPVNAANGNPESTAGNATSAALHSPVTVPSMIYGFDSGTAFQPANNLARTNVAPFVFSGAATVDGANPGVGTAANPVGSITLSNVPAGTYDLFLYAANFDGTRGATFIVSTGTPSNGVFVAMNPYAAAGNGPLTNFVFGTNYVVYNNVTPAVDTTIKVTWGAISNINSSATGEGDFNGLQLVPSVAVAASPRFIQQPADSIYSQNTTATLTSEARGNPAVAYQWYSGTPPGTRVSGQTNSTLTFANAQSGQSGSYFVVATNVNGAATSSVANLTIAASPLIVSQSSTNSLTLFSGHNRFGLSVSALGAAPLYYFWRANGTTAAVTTNSGSFGFTNTTTTAAYDCVVSNVFGTATNNPLSVTIVPAPTTPYVTALLALNPLAYWPLTETSGSLAYDYLAGNNGPYQGPVANSAAGPGTGFGSPSYAYSFSGASTYLDVPGGPVNLTGPLTLVTWTSGSGSSFQTVAGKGDSSYRTDVDGNGVAHFSNYNANDAVGGPSLKDASIWHQIIGVYDNVAKKIYLYVDGLLVNTQSQPNNPPGNTLDFWIGGAPDYNNRFFQGSIAHVALFNYALTGAQVHSLYAAGQAPPYFVTEPTNSFNGFVGGNATFTVAVGGAPTLQLQWSGPGGGIPGATNASVTLTNLNGTGSPANGGPGNYFCIVTNLYGSVTSSVVTLTVSSSSPFFVQDLSVTNYAVAGSVATLSVDVGGNEPLTNQWYYGSTPLHNGDRGGRVSGVTNLTLAIANAQLSDDGPYQIFITNGVSPYSAMSAVGQLVVENEPHFNGNGQGWTLNGGAAIATDVLTLTDGNNSETRSAWLNVPMYIGAFKASFIYQAATGSTGTNSLADGVSFCLQNSAAGLAALGVGGGGIGYQGIENSAAIIIDLFNARGYQYITGGQDPRTTSGGYIVTAPTVDPYSRDPISVVLVYNGNTLALTLTDTTTLGTYHTNMVIGPLSSVVNSNTALIGFSGATGGFNSIQTISAFSFVPTPPLSVSRTGSSGVVISWPTGVGGYVLQSNASLNNSAGWTTIPGPYTIVGSTYRLTLATTTGVQFYRLVVTP